MKLKSWKTTIAGIAVAVVAALLALGYITEEQATAIGLKSDLASPTFTGVPAAPTAVVGTNSTQLATTAFVNAEIASDATPISHVGSTGTAHGIVTASVNGFMIAADKSKLDGIAANATANTGTVTGVTGTGAIVSTGGTAPAISISAATTSAAGSMSGADKTKLDAITGTNTGDETDATIKTKLGITTLSGNNTGDQIHLRYEKLATEMTVSSSIATIPDAYSRSTIPYMAI